MKEEVELKKEDIRNMTMIFNSPEMMMNLSMQNGYNPDSNTDLKNTQNILDDLDEHQEKQAHQEDEENDLRESNNSLFNVSGVNGHLNSSSFMNMSSNRGLNTTINNFIKSILYPQFSAKENHQRRRLVKHRL